MTEHPCNRGRRGTVGVAAILVLVILQLVIIAIVISGARDVDTTMQRLDSTRAGYAADGVANMAIRELISGVDESGDGTVGSIASGVVASGPNIGGANAAASVTVSGTDTTVAIKGTENIASRAISIVVKAGSGAVNPIASYAAYASPTVPTVKEFNAGAWGSAVNTSALTGNVCWEALKTSPVGTANPSRALVSLAQDTSLSIAQYGGGVWGAASVLTSGAGTCNTPVFATDWEGQTGNLMVAYRKGSNTNIFYRTYTSATPAEQSFSMGLAAAPTWMEMAAKPGSNELVLVASAGGVLKAQVWSGSAWGNTTTLENFLPTAGRPFHIAYMNMTGSALVVWTATSGAPKFATWNGSSWSVSSSLPAIAGGVPAGWVKLVGSPLHSSDEVLMACIGTNNQINVNNWTGSAWGANLVVETSAAANDEARVDVAYQPNGALGLVAWHKSGQTALRYRTWSGGAWSAQQTGPDLGSDSNSIRLERGYNPTEIMMLARRAGAAGYAGYNVYSQNSTVTTGNTTISGQSGGSVSGVSLPTPPSATANSNNISPSSGTVAPGTYGTMSVGGTVGFTAGTYIFSTVTVGGTLNFDTSAGPVIFIITTGGLSGVNNNSLINTGSGVAQINVLNGNVDFKNNTTFTNIDLFVYNGTATFKNNANGSLNLWASGAISFGNSGAIDPNGATFGVPPIATAVLWTAGSPGSKVDLCASMTPAGVGDPCTLSGSPVPANPAIDSWTAVSP